jgi:hypothetical protein
MANLGLVRMGLGAPGALDFFDLRGSPEVPFPAARSLLC